MFSDMPSEVFAAIILLFGLGALVFGFLSTLLMKYAAHQDRREQRAARQAADLEAKEISGSIAERQSAVQAERALETLERLRTGELSKGERNGTV